MEESIIKYNSMISNNRPSAPTLIDISNIGNNVKDQAKEQNVIEDKDRPLIDL